MTPPTPLLDTLRAALDPAASRPLSAQLRAALTDAIARGDLRPGEALPTVRAVAAALGLAVNTVAKTYAALRADGLTENRAGAGTTVAAGAWTVARPAEREAVAAFTRHAHDLLGAGVAPDALRAALDRAVASGTAHDPDADPDVRAAHGQDNLI